MLRPIEAVILPTDAVVRNDFAFNDLTEGWALDRGRESVR